MKKIFQVVVLYTLIGLLWVSCGSDSEEDLISPTPDVVTYETDIKNLIDPNCATSQCHSANANAGGLSLETYTQVKNAFLNNNALGRIEDTNNPMPPSGNLSAANVSLLKKWIDQGYLN